MTRMRDRCLACAAAHTLPQWKITYRRSLSGKAWPAVGEMIAPLPVTRKALYIYLHECAHIHLGHTGAKPSHVQEMEAEKQAHKWMREAGIPVPRAMTRRAKAYVGRKIQEAFKRGAKKVDSRAAQYAGFDNYTRHLDYAAPVEIEGIRLSSAQEQQLDIFPFWVIKRFECNGKRFWDLTVADNENGDWPIEVRGAFLPHIVKLAKVILK